jgi:hypothetical protein
MLLYFARHSAAVVFNGNLCVAISGLADHIDSPVRVDTLQCISDQVQNDLPDFLWINLSDDRLAGV